MKLKKLLLVIEIILAIFLIIGIVYLSYKLYLKVMGIQDYAEKYFIPAGVNTEMPQFMKMV